MNLPQRLGMTAAICAAIASIGFVAGCGAERDQNVEKKSERDTAPALIINEPQGFRNVSFKCFGPNGVYVTSRGDSLSSGSQGSELPSSVYVVKDDANCNGGNAPKDQPTTQPQR